MRCGVVFRRKLKLSRRAVISFKITAYMSIVYLSNVKRIFVWVTSFLAFLTGNPNAEAQDFQLSNAAEISVITCGPDVNELYSAFGHSAIRVRDPQLGFDYAFNYGVFDFDQPNFYLNFARGRNYYLLAAYDFADFEQSYRRAERFIHEQRLNLSQGQKQKVFDFLVWNAQKENRTYRYDYYHDNCASRIRDVLQNQLGQDLVWDSSFFEAKHSFREKTGEYLNPLPWGDLGIDICLGRPIDRKMTAWEYMFLPDYIDHFVQHARVRTDSAVVPLVAERVSLFEPRPQPAWTAFVHPWIAFGGLFVLVAALTLWDWRRKKISRWLDVVVFGVSGIIGLLLVTLWVATDHHDAAQNFNLLWAFPLHVAGVVLLVGKKPAAHRYFLFSTILLSVTIVLWPIWPQQLNPFLLPVVAALLLRAMLIWRLTRKTE
jgi:hypothetical protein